MIGGNVTILSRGMIGNNVVAAVGTVVTKNLPDNCLVSGVLAKKIKDIENDRAAYGKQLLRYLSEKLTEEFGKGFNERNLRNMRQFYLTFPIRNSLRSELSWTHYGSLIKIKSFYYQRILASKDRNSVSAEIDTLEPKLEYLSKKKIIVNF